MIQRLLLDGIDVERGRASVAELNQAAFDILSDEAETSLVLSDVAVARTEITVETAVGHRLPPSRLVEFRHDSVRAC